jgi:hypothetical protein
VLFCTGTDAGAAEAAFFWEDALAGGAAQSAGTKKRQIESICTLDVNRLFIQTSRVKGQCNISILNSGVGKCKQKRSVGQFARKK